MTSLILRTATRLLLPLLLLFSIFLLLRGHNEPGGGFVGGLVAASGFILYGIAYDEAAARRALYARPRRLIATGLALALGSGLLALALGRPMLTGIWFSLPGTAVEIGTPLIFDLGVYLAVLGVAVEIVLTLAEE